MSLAGLNNYFVPLSLDGLDAFTQSVQDNALLLDGSNMMLADVNCGTHAVKNMAAATTSDEAVNLGQLTSTLGNYVDLTSNQTIGGTKSFSNQVIFSGATKTNLVATDIPNSGSLSWLNSSGTQTISGSKSWGNSQTWNGPNANFNTTTFNVSATTTTNLNNGALCNNKRLQNVADPTAAQDASTKAYVDAAVGAVPLSNYVTLATTQTITGEKQFNGKIGLDALDLTPVFTAGANIDFDASTLKVRSKSLNGIAFKAWSTTVSEPATETFTIGNGGYFGTPLTDGGMFLNGSSDIWLNVGSNTLYSKIYQDTTSNKLVVNSFESAGGGIVSFNSGKLVGGVDTFTEVLRVGGDAVTALKPLAMSSNKVTGLANGSAATDAAAVGQVLLLNGTNTMAANLAMGVNKVTGMANGSAATDAATVGQVLLLNGTQAMTANLAMGSNKVTGLANGTAATDAAAVGQVLLLNGTNTMSGQLAMGSNRITGLAPSSAGTDAVNRDELTSAVYIETTQTVTTNVFTINDSTPTITLLNFNGGLVSLPATGVSAGKVLKFINIYNSSNAASLWSNVGTGSIDGVTGAQQLVRLDYNQSVTFVARGSGAYSTVAIDLLPPHARVKASYGSNDIGLWTWDGNVLNSTTERMRVGSSAITGYVPFAPTVWSSGQLMMSYIAQINSGDLIDPGVSTTPGVVNGRVIPAGQILDVIVNYTLKSYSDRLSLHVDSSYTIAGYGADTITLQFFDRDSGSAYVQVYSRQHIWNTGGAGGGTRSVTLFPALCVSTATSTNSLSRILLVRIVNGSNDAITMTNPIHVHVSQVKN